MSQIQTEDLYPNGLPAHLQCTFIETEHDERTKTEDLHPEVGINNDMNKQISATITNMLGGFDNMSHHESTHL